MADKYWFKHDYNARNDEKLLELRAEFGAEGYGIFWMIIEKIAENNQGGLNGRLMGGLAMDLSIDKNLINSIVNFCIQVKLFHKNDEEFISSNRMKAHKEMRDSLSEYGKKGVEKREQNRKNKPRIKGGLSQPLSEEIRREEIRREDNGHSPDFFVRVEKFIRMFNGLRGTKYKPIQDVQTALENQLKTYTPEQIKFALKNAIKDKYHIDNNFKSLTPKYLLQTDILERYVNITQIPKELPAPGSFKIDHSSMNEKWNKSKILKNG